MKKIAVLLIFIAACTNSAFAISYCECGLYAGAQAGFAIIKTPMSNGMKYSDFRGEGIDSRRGSFAWGINCGYNYPVFPDLLVGFEAGYHDNGSSSFTFSNKNEYKVDLTDWDLLATGTYIFYPGFWLNLKVGAANVRQVNRIWHIAVQDVDPTAVSNNWRPTTTLSFGYNFCNFDLYFAYRYVYGKNQSSLRDFYVYDDKPKDVSKDGKIVKEVILPSTLQMRDQSAWVHSVYIGLQASIY